MRFDELANLVPVFYGHNDVCDYDIGALLLNLFQGEHGIMAGEYIDVLPSEGDLDDFTHGGAIVNEINRGHRRHQKPPSKSLCIDSSSSRRASSINSVEERSTVRVAAVSPGRNLYDPESCPLQCFTICTMASSPTLSPHSA